MKAIIGLGNFGEEYKNTRHNVGFFVIDRLADLYNISFNTKKSIYNFGIGEISGEKVVLVKPLTYMNRSGHAVRQAIKEYSLDPADLIVVHDDIDIQPGRCKKKMNGGDGGQRGIRSIIASIGTKEFIRIRIGLGRPPSPEYAAEYVLSRFKKSELEIIDNSINEAIVKIEEIIKGI